MGTKTVHRLQLPGYATPEWPTLSIDDESSILQHLLGLLKPIGDHRRHNVTPSKYKGRKKRKRNEGSSRNGSTGLAAELEPEIAPVISPLTIGFNSTVGALETISRRSKPPILPEVVSDAHVPAGDAGTLGAVFVCHSMIPDTLTSIPYLIASASLAQPQQPPIRLVQLSAKAERLLAEVLYQPRVGFIGVPLAAPNVDALMIVVRAAVKPVIVPWLAESAVLHYLPVQIESIQTSVGSKCKSTKDTQPSGAASSEIDTRVAKRKAIAVPDRL